MGRKPRIDVAGGIYHVAARGNGRIAIFDDAIDRTTHLIELAITIEMYELILLAYVQMTNHFHLLIETTAANLGAALKRLNGLYARRYNRRHGQSDHLFRAHPSCTRVLLDSHLMVLGRYFDLNPVRAGLCTTPEEWEWGSHRAIAGLAPAPEFLASGRILAYFGDDTKRAQGAYRQFVAAGAGPKTDPELHASLELAQSLAMVGVGHGVGHLVAG